MHIDNLFTNGIYGKYPTGESYTVIISEHYIRLITCMIEAIAKEKASYLNDAAIDMRVYFYAQMEEQSMYICCHIEVMEEKVAFFQVLIPDGAFSFKLLEEKDENNTSENIRNLH